jgi:hypothetical protein
MSKKIGLQLGILGIDWAVLKIRGSRIQVKGVDINTLESLTP